MLIDQLHDLFDQLDAIEFHIDTVNHDFYETLELVCCYPVVQELTNLLIANPILHCAVITRIKTILDRPFDPLVQDLTILALLIALHDAELDMQESTELISPSRKFSYCFVQRMVQTKKSNVSVYATAKLPKSQGGEIEVGPKLADVFLEATGEVPEWIPDLRARIEMAQTKYGQPLLTRDGRDTLVDLLQELYDADNYVAKLALERDPRFVVTLPQAISALAALTSCVRQALDRK